jgi:hypothetical protein
MYSEVAWLLLRCLLLSLILCKSQKSSDVSKLERYLYVGQPIRRQPDVIFRNKTDDRKMTMMHSSFRCAIALLISDKSLTTSTQ